jgi:predicted TPR repeat methyltransferase
LAAGFDFVVRSEHFFVYTFMNGLPTLQSVSENVAMWSVADNDFAAILNAGQPAGQALARWGLRLLKQQRIDEAAAVLRSALALAPCDPALWINYGLTLDKSKDYSEAAACFEKSLTFSPHQPDAWLLLGLACKKGGDFVGAEAAYRKTLELDPFHVIAWQCLGLLKEAEKDYPAAIEYFNNCIRSGGASAPILANFGKLCFQTGRFPEAYDAYRKAVELDSSNLLFRQMSRKARFLCDVLKLVPIENTVEAYRASFVPPENFAEPDLIDLFDQSIALLGGFGQVNFALRLGKQRLELWPGSETIPYLLQSMANDSRLDRSPEGFIVEHFDALAENFDVHLVNGLGYDIPGKLVAAIQAATPAGHRYDVLDGGCGTGLCAPLLRPMARTLIGVDLSPKMLDQAAKRGLYDEILLEEFTRFLDRSPARFDLVVAADVFIYFGEVNRIFKAAATAIRPGGLLAFSTESGPDAGYCLLPSGRFAHAPDYVRGVAGADFVEELCAETTVRLETTRRLSGHLFVFRRR